jgi:hypothetical protein
MADNVELNPGTGGAVVATDDDGTAQHQYVKLEYGADGTFTKVAAGANALPVQGAETHDAAVAGKPVLMGGYAANLPPTNVATGDAVNAWYYLNGAQAVQVAFAGASWATGNGGVSAGTPRVAIASDSQGNMSVIPTNGSPIAGVTSGRVVSAASTNATSIRSSQANLYGWVVSNVNAAARYVKLYDKATAPTVGTDTPFLTIMVPPNQTISTMATMGRTLTNGIGLAMTTGAADTDTGAVAADEVLATIFYK